jgi:antitoxin component of RelBE/YafQ-DinJ toxin-antitoxin module
MGKKEIKIRIDEKIIENFKETGLDISEYAEMLLKRAIETRQGKQLK